MTSEPKEPRAGQCREKVDREQEENRQERSYYYDDAHGYETYDPESDDADEVEHEGTQPNGDPDQKGIRSPGSE